jgi:hypothetical protein
MKDENWHEIGPVPVLDRGVKTLYSKTRAEAGETKGSFSYETKKRFPLGAGLSLLHPLAEAIRFAHQFDHVSMVG